MYSEEEAQFNCPCNDYNCGICSNRRCSNCNVIACNNCHCCNCDFCYHYDCGCVPQQTPPNYLEYLQYSNEFEVF